MSETASQLLCIRVLLVDDYELVRQGLRLIINQHPLLQVVGEARDGMEALELASQRQPDIILLDIELGLDNGLDFLPRLLEVSGAKVIVFTGAPDKQTHHEAFALGASAVVVKGDSNDALLSCILRVYEGQTPQPEPEREKIALLTPQERDIIALLSGGVKRPQVCEQLGLEGAAVKNALASAQNKLGVANEVELVVYAYRHGLAHVHGS